ncbi:hypothetical protein TIFTF001_028622 [Ficus carica]|uniref:Uncharacterized protein n=1 Tax=Ficus carica TaxID=3494 RepID=A0AA88DQR0_FICCA|nr:hypothetical protein TIFTF001_028622 [Ficus carica]
MYRGGEAISPPSVVDEDASGMVACTLVGAGLSLITCDLRLNYSDAEEARQRVASAHNTCHTTRQMGLDFGLPQAWRDMDVIGLYAQLYLAPVSQEVKAHRHLLVILYQYISLVSLLFSKSRHQTTLISPPLVSAPYGGSPTSLYEALFLPKFGRKGLEDREKPRMVKLSVIPWL